MSRIISVLALSLAAVGCATVDNGAPAPVASADEEVAPAKPVFRLADIAGKAAGDLDALLGAPDLTRVEGAGEFRRYKLADCALIVILYPDDDGVKRARQIDAGALTSGVEKPDIDRCLARGMPKPS